MTLVHRVNFVSMFPGIFSCLYACLLEKKEITYVVHSIQVKCHRESMTLYTCMHAYTTIFNLVAQLSLASKVAANGYTPYRKINKLGMHIRKEMW